MATSASNRVRLKTHNGNIKNNNNDDDNNNNDNNNNESNDNDGNDGNDGNDDDRNQSQTKTKNLLCNSASVQKCKIDFNSCDVTSHVMTSRVM